MRRHRHTRTTAQPPLSQALRKKLPPDLGSWLKIAFASNAKLKAARSRWRAVIARYPQALSLPDPLLSYTYFVQNVETRVGPQRHRLTISQKLPFPAKLYYRSQLVKKDIRLARLNYEIVLRDLVSDIEEVYYELGYLERALQISKENAKLLGQFLHLAATEQAAGRLTLSALMRGQAQLAQVKFDSLRLTELRSASRSRLAALLNRPQPLQWQGPVTLTSPPLDYPDYQILYRYGLQHNQEIRAARLRIAKGAQAVALARSDFFPDLTLSFSWIETGPARMSPAPADSGQDAYALTFGINLPLWFAKKNAHLRELKCQKRAAQYASQQLEHELAAELQKVYVRVVNNARLIRLYRDTLIPQARQAMHLSEQWVRQGQESFFSMLDAQRSWLNFNLAQARAIADYGQNLALLARMVGGDLPR